jgi:hypothetical protein
VSRTDDKDSSMLNVLQWIITNVSKEIINKLTDYWHSYIQKAWDGQRGGWFYD